MILIESEYSCKNNPLLYRSLILTFVYQYQGEL